MTCKYCGTQLPEGSTFCPVCAKSLAEKQVSTPPQPRKKKLLLGAGILAVLAVLAVVLLLPDTAPQASPAMQTVSRPASYLDWGAVPYTDDDGTYQLLLTCDNTAEVQKSYTTRLPASGNTTVPCKLWVLQDGKHVEGAFMKKVKSSTVTLKNVSGAEMTATEPAVLPEHSGLGEQVCLVGINSDCEEAILTWTVVTESSYTLIIQFRFLQQTRGKVAYFADDVPMATDEELDALLRKIEEETDPYDLVQIFFPAATYTEPHTFPNRSYQLLGTIDGGTTVFTDTVTISDSRENSGDFQNVVFEGNGTGTGLVVGMGWDFLNCTFRNWDTAIQVQEPGTASLSDSVLENNRTGVHWAAGDYVFFNAENARVTFRGNDTAIYMERLLGTIPIVFADSVFENNGTDLENPIGYPIHID